MPKYNSGLKYNNKSAYNSAPIIIFVTDSGSGGDALEVLVAVPIDETGTGIDAALVNALISAIDGGVGADSTTATGNIAATDSGQGDDSIITSATVEPTDSGVGTDLAQVAKTYYLVDENNVLQPLNVKVLRDSLIDLLPEIKVNSDTIPGRHGEIYFDSKLGVRAIELSVATEEYTVEQREALKRTIAQYLNPVSDAKALMFASDLEKQYMVKYAGKIDLSQHHPTWMQFVIPFKSATSYIIGSFEEEHIGSGTLTNVGNEETPLTIEIVGPATNPSVTVGTSTLAYSGTVNGGSVLVIDTEKMTVELDGVNALPDYSGGFPWLSVGDTAVIAASTGITVFRYRGRWL